MKISTKWRFSILFIVVLLFVLLFSFTKNYIYVKVILSNRLCTESQASSTIKKMANSKSSIDYCISNIDNYWACVILKDAKDGKYKDYVYIQLIQAISKPDNYKKIFLYRLLYEYCPQKMYAVSLFSLVKNKPELASFSRGHDEGRKFLAIIMNDSTFSPDLDDNLKMVNITLTEEEFDKMYDVKYGK